MATAAIFSFLRRRRSPTLEAFLAPVDLTGVALVKTLASVSSEFVSSFSERSFFFQRRNARGLIRKIEVFVVMLECLKDLGSDSGSDSERCVTPPPTVVLCLKELYLLFYRSKILLDYCTQSSKLWLLLQNHSISSHFHDLNQEISTLLDVFPIDEVKLTDDIREQLELLKKQTRKSKLNIDKSEEALRIKFFSFLNEFENARVPNKTDLASFFIEKLGINDAGSCSHEIEFLEEQIVNHEGDIEPTASVLNGFVGLTRYCRFLLFGFEEDELKLRIEIERNPRNGLMITQEIVDTDTLLTIPKDFSCPISLDLMKDPVIISTGQTYDRSSIARWFEEGHFTCPKTGQLLDHSRLVSNRALRNLIMQWCNAHGVHYDTETPDSPAESFPTALPSKAAIEANKATAMLLINQLAKGSESAQSVAAREIRLLAKTGKENRAFIAEAGAIPHLRKLLLSENPITQENSVTAMLNLSIYEKNKSRIMDDEDCLQSIVDVLRFGLTTEGKENAAATLFSLSAVHDYKKRIADEEGAVEALATLLRVGTRRGKKDAVTALFNLSTHTENCGRMIESEAVNALVGALRIDNVAEEAAGALALIVRQPIGAEAVGNEEHVVAGLIGMMRCGTPRGKENAVAVLLELCRSGGSVATERVVRAPALAGLLQTLLFTGTKRARRKAASLARVFQRCDNAAAALHFGGLGVGYAFAGNSAANRDSSFAGDVSVAMQPISVPVL